MRLSILALILSVGVSYAGVTFNPNTGVGTMTPDYGLEYGTNLPSVVWKQTDEIFYRVTYSGGPVATQDVSTWVTYSLSSSVGAGGINLTGHNGVPTTLWKVPAVGDTYQNPDGTTTTVTSVSSGTRKKTTIHGILNNKFSTAYVSGY